METQSAVTWWRTYYCAVITVITSRTFYISKCKLYVFIKNIIKLTSNNHMIHFDNWSNNKLHDTFWGFIPRTRACMFNNKVRNSIKIHVLKPIIVENYNNFLIDIVSYQVNDYLATKNLYPYLYTLLANLKIVQYLCTRSRLCKNWSHTLQEPWNSF